MVSASAQPSPIITEVRIEQEGRTLADPLIDGLIETSSGEPLSMREVRDTITHLMSLNRFEDVQVFQESLPAGIRLRYVLLPRHPIDRIEYLGVLGAPEQDLRRTLTDRFGASVTTARIEDLQAQLRTFYENRGYRQATVTPRVEPTHDPHRASLVFDIQAGRRGLIRAVEVRNADDAERQALLGQPALRLLQPYDAELVQRVLEREDADLRARGYYEARADYTVDFGDGDARITISLNRGPHISLAFAGDPIHEDERDRLVPVRTEASVDEDLLEDSSRAIEDYLKTLGYRDAIVSYRRDLQGNELTITFTVSRGPRYLLDRISVTGNVAMFTPDVLDVLGVESDAPYVQERLDAGIAAVRNTYRNRGFTRVDVTAAVSQIPRAPAAAGGDRHVELAVVVSEGPRTRIGSIAIEGNAVLTESRLRGVMTVAPGRPYSEAEVAADRDRIDLEYRNLGYDSVVVHPTVTFAEGDTRADVRLVVSEGPQVFVDHIIIVGNQRTSTATIERELALSPGQPLGYAALLDSQQRLGALGLFRRIQITPLTHVGEPRRDILIQVEEAPPTTIGYGGGVEVGVRLRPTGDNGQAEERFDLAPRGFFEVGRRNLWGKNRAVNLFTRVSLRSRDIVLSEDGVRLDTPAPESGYGFHEYRVYGTYREPRVFNSRFDVLLTGIVEQAIRSSFNFQTREVRAEAGTRLSQRYSLAGRYSFEHTRLFDQRFTEDEKPLIDRLFPQVRLSRFSTSFIRDTRDDVLYPNKGTFSVADSEVAARAIGSQVGFAKTFVQGFAYWPLPTTRRVIAAFGARLGVAHGFPREVPRVDAAGLPVRDEAGQPIVDTVQDLPASARFFAGGDTTVRGFSLDRLGDERTISPAGFPTGGNAEVVLNAELRVSIFGQRAEAVGFLDAGNIFPRATDLDLTHLRSAIGFGLRYRSPVGPIRVDLGFNLDRRELVPGRLERANVLHISLGQAF